MIEPYKFIILFLQFANHQITKMWQNYNKKRVRIIQLIPWKEAFEFEKSEFGLLFKKEKERRKKRGIGKTVYVSHQALAPIIGIKMTRREQFFEGGLYLLCRP